MAANGMPPLPEFLSQGMMLVDEGLRFEILQSLMHQIKGGVNQLCSLFRRHGTKTKDGQ